MLAVAVYYPKPAAAARWLADAFGLVPTNPIPDHDDAWIEFHIGNSALLIFRTVPPGSPAPAPTHVPWIYVDDLDAHFAWAVSYSADTVEGLHQHGYHAYTARDPDGLTWMFAQASPGMR